MNQQKKLAIILAGLSLLVFTGVSWGQGIKERMRQRLPVIVDLKARGLVGENNQGFLQYLKEHSERKAVVAAENADRKLVYQAIAKKQGIPVGHVGKRRAMQIATKAKAGEWVQNEKGQWYQIKP